MVFVDICIDYLITRFIRSDFQLGLLIEILKMVMIHLYQLYHYHGKTHERQRKEKWGAR